MKTGLCCSIVNCRSVPGRYNAGLGNGFAEKQMAKFRTIQRMVKQSLFLCVLASLLTFISIPAHSKSTTNPEKLGTIDSFHAVQQHHRIGTGDMYWNDSNVKWVFNDGDFVCMFRGKEQMVYLFLPVKKVIFEQPFSQFRKQGITFTSGTQESCRVFVLKDMNTQSMFLKFPVKHYGVYAKAKVTGGNFRLADIATIVAMVQPPKSRDVADFITLAYGLPKLDSVILDMTMKFRLQDGSLWFKTREKDLPSVVNQSSQTWLRTIKLERIKVAADFFDAPKNFKKVDSQEKVLGMAPAAKDFEDLLYAEPNSKK